MNMYFTHSIVSMDVSLIKKGVKYKMKKMYRRIRKDIREDIENIIGGLSIVAILYSLYIIMCCF